MALRYWLVLLLVGIFLISGCVSSHTENKTNETNQSNQIANPASVYCVELGFNSTIRNNPDGSQTGYCIFPTGKECEEWAFYRGECKL